MPEASNLAVNAPVPAEANDMFVEGGAHGYSRRLTDKILTAFCHAYSIGETEMAETLHAVLDSAERQEAAKSGGRRYSAAVEQADLWIEFVKARDRYRVAKEGSSGEAPDTSPEFQEMKEAYRRWSSR